MAWLGFIAVLIAILSFAYTVSVTERIRQSRSELHAKYMATCRELFDTQMDLVDVKREHRQLIDRIRAYEHTQDWVVGLELTKEKDEHGKS
jgi:hypothetical protein